MIETSFLVLTATLSPIVLENSFFPFSILCDRVSGEGSKSELPWPLPTLCVFVAQLCLTLCDSMDCSPPGSSVHGIFQARILEWVAFPFSRESSQPRDWTQVSCIMSRFFTSWATREARILEWVAYPFCSGSSQPRNWTRVFCIAGRFFTNWAMREAMISKNNPKLLNKEWGKC